MDNGASSYRRFLAGDNDALVEIIRDYKDGLMYFLNGFVNDLTIAEELMEDTFVRLYTKKPRYSEKSSFKTWLYGIGRNVAREYLHRERKSRTTPLNEHTELSDDTYEPESSFFRNEQYRELHRALKKLKPEYHQVLWLYFFEDLRDKEIAVIMRKSPNNVNVLLHRAKKALKTQLKKEGFMDENIS